MSEYWLKENADSEELGPYPGRMVKQFVTEDRIGPEWLISSDRKKWSVAGSVKGLFPPAAATASTPPPPPGQGPAIAAILLGPTPFSLELLQKQLTRNPSPGQGPVSIDKGILIYEQDKAFVAVSPMPGPYPWRDLEGPCATSWMWPEGTSAMIVKDHRLHALVTVVGGKLAPIQRRLLLTRVTAMAAQQPAVMAVYWAEGTLVHYPKLFVEMGQQITSAAAPPLHLWIDYRVHGNPDGSIQLFTTGLDKLGMMEIEIPSIDMNPAQLRDWAINITYYLIEKGPVLKHNDTIGISAAHQMRVRHAESMYQRRSPGPVLRIEAK